MIFGKKKKGAKAEGAPALRLNHYDVLRTPVITEKTTLIGEQNKVVFRVVPTASKADVKEAVEAIFGVKVKAVNTLVRKGKARGFRGNAGQRSDTKQAIVTLEAGQTLDMAAGAKA